LAAELGVNPNTIAKSYQALLDRNIIVNHRGKGYFVSNDAGDRILSEMREEFISEELPKVIRAMRLLGIGPEEIARQFARYEKRRRAP
jgi:DNA-binding transcriptional regulator YhcF (GntR family)